MNAGEFHYLDGQAPAYRLPNALYHIASRGNRREDIYLNDNDRNTFLDLLLQVRDRFNWVFHSYSLMSNHYHLLVETPEANLSMGTRQLNGVYTQRFNQAHRRDGQVFQGRSKAILVQKDAYLLELSRYIVLIPVRAGIVRSARDWRWSNYRATVGLAPAPVTAGSKPKTTRNRVTENVRPGAVFNP